MTMIRIAFFAESLKRGNDGAINTIYKLIDEANREQFEFLFFTSIPPDGDIGFPVVEIPGIQFPGNSSYKIGIHFGIKDVIKTRLRDFIPDLIHISTPSYMGHWALNYARAHNIMCTTIYHTHFISYVDYYIKRGAWLKSMGKKLLLLLLKRFYNRFDKVFVPTTEICEELNAYGFNTSNFIIWKRGVDTSLFSPDSKFKNSLSAIASEKTFNILFVSRLVWEKNLETLIRIYKIACHRELPVNFTIVGDGPVRLHLESQMPRARFLGHVDHSDLALIYAQSDLFLFPSVTETFGNVILEAFASGLPVLIANKGGASGLARHGMNGFLCRSFDAEDYISKLEIFIENSTLRKLMSQNALNCSKLYDWKKIVAEFYHELQQLVNRKEPIGFVAPISPLNYAC